MEEDERLIIVSAIGIVDKALISIDKDKSQCATLADLADKYSNVYELYFANGGDQNNNSIPEVPICQEKGIVLIDVGKAALSAALSIIYPTSGCRVEYCTAIAGILIKNSDWKMELLLSRIFKSLLVLIDLIF